MNVEKTVWTQAEQLTISPGAVVNENQPSLGVEVLWNKPFELWKPCLVIHLWHWHINIGWLVD